MRILIYTAPAIGHLFPIVDVALELLRRGHDVEVVTLRSQVAALGRVGLRAAPVDPRIEALPLDDWGARTQIGSLIRATRVFVRRAEVEVDDFSRALRSHRPDVALVDISTWGAAAIAEARGMRWACFAPYPLPLPSRDAPPFGLGLTPRSDAFGRARDAVATGLLGALARAVVGPLDAVRQRVGATPLGDLRLLSARAPLVLSLTAEPFELPHRDWPSSVCLVGPGLWAPEAPLPEALAASPKPLVVVATSSELQRDAGIARAAVEAFRGSEFRVLVTDPAGQLADLKREGAGGDVVVERFVSHAAVVPRASLVVCHGGMGITQRALAAGVPVVVVPHGRDQLDVAARVERCRAGVAVPPSRLTAARLRSAGRRALERAPGARRVAEAFERAGGFRLAADRIEALAEGRSEASLTSRQLSPGGGSNRSIDGGAMTMTTTRKIEEHEDLSRPPPAAVAASLRDERERVVLRHTACENEHSVDGTMRTFARHRYEIVPTSQTFDGEPAVRALHGETLRAFPDFHVYTERLHHADDVVIAEVRFVGTHLGSWRGLLPTERRVDYRMCNMFLFEGADLVCERMYFDTASLLRQLGIARDPETRSGRFGIALAHPIVTATAVLRSLRAR